MAQAVEAGATTVESLDHPLYPSLRHALFTSWELDPNSPLHQFYFKETIGSTKLGDAIKAVSLIRNYLESKSDRFFLPTQHIRAACNPNLLKVLETFKWFDQDEQIFCDKPLPHLLVDLLLGLYGHPYHCNTRTLERIAYKARNTVMFTDVFVLDQARYLYDLLPTLPLFEDRFKLPEQQLVLRVCMDAIHRHSHFGCSDLFHGCALAPEGEEGFTYWPRPVRQSLGCPPIGENG